MTFQRDAIPAGSILLSFWALDDFAAASGWKNWYQWLDWCYLALKL